jgi:serine/threonine protein kinase
MVNTLWPVLTDPPLPLQACSLDAVRGDFCISLEGYTVADGRLALLLELADPKSHVSVAGRVLSSGSDLRWAAFVGKGLARGIQTVHAAGRIHRDVKPENLLLQDGAPKLADFGAAAMGKRVEGLVRNPSLCHRYPFLVQTKSTPLWRCRGALLPYPELLWRTSGRWSSSRTAGSALAFFSSQCRCPVLSVSWRFSELFFLALIILWLDGLSRVQMRR